MELFETSLTSILFPAGWDAFSLCLMKNGWTSRFAIEESPGIFTPRQQSLFDLSHTLITQSDDLLPFLEPHIYGDCRAVTSRPFPAWFEFTRIYFTDRGRLVKECRYHYQVGNAGPPLSREAVESANIKLISQPRELEPQSSRVTRK